MDGVYAKHGLNNEDKVARQDIVTQLELLVRAVVPGKRYTGSTSVCNVFVLIYLYILYSVLVAFSLITFNLGNYVHV